MPKVRGCCGECDWWVKDGDHAVLNGGWCRRYPPVGIEIEQDDGTWPDARWPFTRDGDWCGEWKRR